MKKVFRIFYMCIGVSTMLIAQDVLVNGNFNDGLNGWTHNAFMDGAFEGFAEVVEDDAGPSMGSGPYLWMFCEGDGYMNQLIWQAVTVQPGDTLRADGAFIDLSGGTLVQYWMELYLGLTEPPEAADYLDNKLFAFDAWATPPCASDMDGMFQTDACVNNTTDGLWIVPDTISTEDVTLYFVIKTGIWQDGGLGVISYEVGLDSLSLVKVGGASAVNSNPEALPSGFTLHPNFPNPFNPSTTIRFTVNRSVNIALSIYDINGRLVRSLMQESLNAGTYSTQWDGSDGQGNSMPSGVYLCQLKSGAVTQTQRMVLIK